MGQATSTLRAALREAHDAITAFHVGQLRAPHTFERGGVAVHGYHVAVDRAGLYVPGGRAVYPSTVLMTAIPARAAGVPEVVVGDRRFFDRAPARSVHASDAPRANPVPR